MSEQMELVLRFFVTRLNSRCTVRKAKRRLLIAAVTNKFPNRPQKNIQLESLDIDSRRSYRVKESNIY
jgi:hypothetical protein